MTEGGLSSGWTLGKLTSVVGCFERNDLKPISDGGELMARL
jgi:hypothetical protein